MQKGMKEWEACNWDLPKLFYETAQKGIIEEVETTTESWLIIQDTLLELMHIPIVWSMEGFEDDEFLPTI